MKITRLTSLCLLSGLLSLASCGGGDNPSDPGGGGGGGEEYTTITQAQFEADFNAKEASPWTRMEGTDGNKKAPYVGELILDTIAMDLVDGTWINDVSLTSSTRVSFISEFVLNSSFVENWKTSPYYGSVEYEKNGQGKYHVVATTTMSYKFDFVIDKYFYVTNFVQYEGENITRLTNLTWSVGSEWTNITLSQIQSAYNSRGAHPYKHYYSHARFPGWSYSYNISGALQEDGTWKETDAPLLSPSVTDYLFINDSNASTFLSEASTFKTYKNEKYFITYDGLEIIVDSYFCVINFANSLDRTSWNVHAYWYTK